MVYCMNEGHITQRGLFINRGGGAFYQQNNNPKKEWLLGLASQQGQRWIWRLSFAEKKSSRTSSGMVFSKWSNWKRFCDRSYLSQSLMCKSCPSKEVYHSREHTTKFKQYRSTQSSKNKMQKWTSFRQILWTKILLHLSGGKNKTSSQKMGGETSFGRDRKSVV